MLIKKDFFLLLILFLVFAGPLQAETGKHYHSAGDLVAVHPELLSRQMTIAVEGKTLKSNYGGLSCVYYESAVLYFENKEKAAQNQWMSLDSRTSSEETFHIVADDQIWLAVEPSSALRLFVSPSFQRDFIRKRSTLPGRQVDYCLQKGKKYFMWIKKEVIAYGPPRPDGRRETNTYYFIQISDREFKNGQPQVEPTPHYKGWIYSFFLRTPKISMTSPMRAKIQAMVIPAQSVGSPRMRGTSLMIPNVVPPIRHVAIMTKNLIFRNFA